MRLVWSAIKIGIIAAAGWYAFLQLRGRIEGVTLWCLTGFALLGAALLLGALTRLIRGARMARVLARSGARTWEDGVWAVAIGEAVPEAEPLTAPFTGRSCVAYEYRVFRRVTSYSQESSGARELRRHTETVAYGIAQRPFSVRTARGDVAVAGVALLEDVDEDRPADPAAQARARALLAAADALNLSASPFSMMRTLLKGMSGKDGNISGHWRKREAPSDLAGWTLAEKCVKVGAKVCVAGAWNEASRSLSPASGEALELVLGAEKDARHRWVGGSRANALLGALFGVLFLGMPAAFWWAACPLVHGPDNAAFPGEVLRGDRNAVQRQLQAGADPNMRDTFGTPLLLTTRDAETVQALLDGGADPDLRNKDGNTRLQLAALRAETEVVRALLAAGADPDLAGSGGETPVLAALRGGRWAILDLLLAAGAHDPRVLSDSGRLLDGSEEPVQVVRRYLDAIQKQDREAIAEYIGPDRAERIDLRVWADAYPAEVRLTKGYASDDGATLEMAGIAEGGVERRWVFLLQRSREGAEWRILRHWDSGPEGMRWDSRGGDESTHSAHPDPSPPD